MPNYQLAKIYQLICNTTGRRYIGATVQKYLSTRLAHHVSKNNKTSSKEIIEGRNYEMVLIESYPCSSKDELHQRERFHIESMDCINKNIPGRTQKEWVQENKNHILEYQGDYRQQKKDKLLKYNKDYRQQNKDKIQKYNKDYRQKYRKNISQKQKDKYQAKKQTPEDHRAERREYWQSKKEIQKDSLSPIE